MDANSDAGYKTVPLDIVMVIYAAVLLVSDTATTTTEMAEQCKERLCESKSMYFMLHH